MNVRLLPYFYKKIHLDSSCLPKASLCVWLTRMPVTFIMKENHEKTSHCPQARRGSKQERRFVRSCFCIQKNLQKYRKIFFFPVVKLQYGELIYIYFLVYM